MPNHSIYVEHNIEIAHRLMNLPGKCQNIHGHGMWVKLYIDGQLNENGILGDLDFHTIKKAFRGYLDQTWDHHLHLNKDDPWADQLGFFRQTRKTQTGTPYSYTQLPGLQTWPNDPTTENIALWVLEEMRSTFSSELVNGIISGMKVTVQETRTNGAVASL